MHFFKLLPAYIRAHMPYFIMGSMITAVLGNDLFYTACLPTVFFTLLFYVSASLSYV